MNDIVQEKPTQESDDQILKILLAYDGSKHAQAAVELLMDLRLPPHTQVIALAVMPPQHITGHEILQAALNWTADQLQETGLEVTTELKAGTPAATINEMAENFNIDLIVIGARGLRATLGILLGGVAQQVVEYSSCPVLVVHAPYHSYRKVLVVTDGSTSSQAAVGYLCGQERQFHPGCFLLSKAEEVHLMHVLPPHIPPDLAWRAYAIGPEALYPAPTQVIDTQAIEAEEEELGKNILQQAAAALAEGRVVANTVLRRGDAATEIIEYSKQGNFDLIVSGSRGLSQVSGWLLGSVSRKLVHYAGCSVLLVKPIS
ncbi:MAG: universal stress protein [Anaerolineales bacterium]|nr:universal stress protein [Anaerolineales bacterium]